MVHCQVFLLTCTVFVGTNIDMKKSVGRPKKTRKLDEYLDIRVESAEKQAFKDAADVAGIPLSTWIRERLRQNAIRELESVGRKIAFLEDIRTGVSTAVGEWRGDRGELGRRN